MSYYTKLVAMTQKLGQDLLCDSQTQTYNIHKIGNTAVVFTWTFYMLTERSDSVEMWLAYSACLMGFSALQYRQKRNGDRKDRENG